MSGRSCLVAVALAVMAPAVPSQGVTGNLEGSVLDAEEVIIGKARIVTSGSNFQGTREALTDGRGLFWFYCCQPGPREGVPSEAAILRKILF